MSRSALAFRGYNVANLGKTPELLAVPAYADIIEEELRRYSEVCRDVIGRPVDLVRHVREGVEPDLSRYAEAIALVVAVEFAQLRLLREIHEIEPLQAKLAFGYSLGEMSALCACGDFQPERLIEAPLAMASDCAELARDVRMGVVFSRGVSVSEEAAERLCQQITAEGRGVVGISAVLTPNTLLLVGQGDSVARFKAARRG
ncbi:MAG: hypothetical protein KDA61_20570, partial [Planctomycetales bacterium]|nr:hypothetical protein [Planctomycetales bacterium]